MITSEISNLDDMIDQDYYIQQLEKKSGFSKEIISSLVNKQSVTKINQPTKQVFINKVYV